MDHIHTRHFSRDPTYHYLPLLLPCPFWKSPASLNPGLNLPSECLLVYPKHPARLEKITKEWKPVPQRSHVHLHPRHGPARPFMTCSTHWPYCPNLLPHHPHPHFYSFISSILSPHLNFVSTERETFKGGLPWMSCGVACVDFSSYFPPSQQRKRHIFLPRLNPPTLLLPCLKELHSFISSLLPHLYNCSYLS